VVTHLDIEDRFGRERRMPISSSIYRGAIHKIAVIAAVLAAATLVAACGGSHAAHARKSAQANSTIKFATCMRANGVPSFPDSGAAIQSVQGSNGQTAPINGVSVNSLHSALQKCEHYISSRASISAAQPAKFTQETLKVARCMRADGIKSFPDSGTFNTSSALNPQAPAFKAASKKCGVGFATGASLP
jgi:hypothetical protein